MIQALLSCLRPIDVFRFIKRYLFRSLPAGVITKSLTVPSTKRCSQPFTTLFYATKIKKLTVINLY